MKLTKETAELLEAYFAGDPSPETIEAMEAWLREDKKNPRLLAEYGLIDRLIAHEQKQQDASAIFASLLEMEENAEPDFALLYNPAFEPHPAKPDPDAITWQKLYNAASYLTLHALRTRAAAYSAIAAVLLIGAALYLAIVGLGSTPESPELSENTPTTPQNKPAESAPPSLRDQPVATLTNTHNAQWADSPAERALARGSKLHPNTRLTLTTGFAEITTARGAVAIIQAPATIEFSHNKNALQLHSGKLVGICETDASKGFVVSTPHMEITDLGTRFGVDATQEDATEVHVFKGEVRAARPGTKPVVLAADQSAHASAGSNTITSTDHTPDRFAALRSVSGPGTDLRANTVLDTDTNATQWLITTSEHAGQVTFNGNVVACSVDKSGFTREVVAGNAYGFIQHRVEGAEVGKSATATGTWTFSNLPAGRYDVATAFMPKGASSARYTVNGSEVLVDQSRIPAADAGPTFDRGLRQYGSESDIFFTLIGSSVVVPEGGSITVTIDNANVAVDHDTLMDSVAITLVPEADQD